MLWNEAIDLLTSGRVLQALSPAGQSTELTTVQLVALPPEAEPDRYELVVADAHGPRFSRAYHAIRAFERMVGRTGLAHAIAAQRYAHFFPNGSSLSWSDIPLSGWREQA